MDLVLRAPKIPAAGETLTGNAFAMHPGGKGANQAVGVARLGYPVRMIGMVGRDDFGDTLRQQLTKERVDTEHVGLAEEPTGVAAITVDDQGENSITVVPGANNAVTPALLFGKKDVFRSAGMVLAQLEIPLPSILLLAELCTEFQTPLILDPAPAQPLPRELLNGAQWLTPNEIEATVLASGCTSPQAQVDALEKAGARGVVLKRGAAGVAYANTSESLQFVPAPNVAVRDTTAAGDAFNAAFAVALMRGLSLHNSIQFAVTASSLSVTREGAQSSLAFEQEVTAAMARSEQAGNEAES